MNQNNRNNTLIHHIEYLLMNCRSKPSDNKKEEKIMIIQECKNQLKNLIKEIKDIKVIEEALDSLNLRIECFNGSKLEKMGKSWVVEQLNEKLEILRQILRQRKKNCVVNLGELIADRKKNCVVNLGELIADCKKNIYDSNFQKHNYNTSRTLNSMNNAIKPSGKNNQTRGFEK